VRVGNAFEDSGKLARHQDPIRRRAVDWVGRVKGALNKTWQSRIILTSRGRQLRSGGPNGFTECMEGLMNCREWKSLGRV
jgi:hypothetical protein